MHSQCSPRSEESLSESVLHDCKILSNVLLIFNKSKKDGYFQSLMQSFQSILQQEMRFAVSEILQIKPARRGPDIRSQLVNNVYIFKENLKTITRVLIDNVWEQRVQAHRLQEVISRAKLSLHRGRCEEILELQDEENCASSGMISNVSNTLNNTLASKDKLAASIKPPVALEGIPESEGQRDEDEDFDYSYGTDFESRDLRFGSVISRSVSFTRKDARRKSERRGEQNYYETEDLDYTIDFDDDSKAGELLRSQEGARSEKLCTRDDASEMEHKSVSSKHLAKRKGTMSMVNIGNASLDLRRRIRHRKQDSLELPGDRPRKVCSFEPKKETKPFLTWGKAKAVEDLKQLPKLRGSGLNTYMRVEEGHTSSDKSQTSFQDLRKKSRGTGVRDKPEDAEKGGARAQEEEGRGPEGARKTREIERIRVDKLASAKDAQGKLKTKIKRGLAKKWTDKKFSFDKNRSHSPFKAKVKTSVASKVQNETAQNMNMNMSLHNRSMSEHIALQPKPADQPAKPTDAPAKPNGSKFRMKSKPEKKRKKTISPKQIMRGLMRVRRGPETPSINSARKVKPVESSGKTAKPGQSALNGSRTGRGDQSMFKSQDVSLAKTRSGKEPRAKVKRTTLRNMASQASFRPLVSLRSSRTKFKNRGKYGSKRVRKVPIFNFSKLSRGGD